jgi:hypothetical protein
MRKRLRAGGLPQFPISIIRSLFIDNGSYQEEIRRRMNPISATMAEAPAPIPYSLY